MLKKSNPLRSIALLVLVSFCFTSVAWSAPELPIQPLLPAYKASFLKIPSNFGSLQQIEGRSSGRTPFVVLVQDAHAIPEAQDNIKALIQFLKKQNELSNNPRPFRVFTENATGILNPDRIKLLPELPQIERQVIDELALRGELSGVELLAVNESEKVLGVEDQVSHQRNLKQFRKLLTARPEIDSVLLKLETKFRKMMIEGLNPSLREFALERQARKEDRRELLAYIKSFTKSVRTVLAIDLQDGREQLRFPNLTRLLHIHQLEGSFDFDSANREWQIFLKAISVDKLSKQNQLVVEEISEMFIKKSYNHLKCHPRLYLELIASLEIASGQKLETFQHLQKTLGFLTIQTEINALPLFQELDDLESRMEKRLIQSEAEKKILAMRDQFRLASKLVRGEIARDEVNGINEKELLSALNQIDSKSSLFLSTWVSRALEFYHNASRREEKLVKNLLSSIKADKAPLAVLVAGGFHSAGITQLLKNRHIPFAVVSPKISQLPDSYLYRDVMLGKNSDISANTIFRTLLLAPDSGELGQQVIVAAYERVLRSRFPSTRANVFVNQVQANLKFRSELRISLPVDNRPNIGVIGLDSTGTRYIEYFLSLDLKVSGFGFDESEVHQAGQRLRRDVQSFNQLTNLSFFYNPSVDDSAGFSDRNEGLINFVALNDIIIINMNPTKDDEDVYNKKVVELVESLATAAQIVQREKKLRGMATNRLFVFRSIAPFQDEATPQLRYFNNIFKTKGVVNFEVVYQPSSLKRDPELRDVESEAVIIGTLNGQESEGSQLIRTLYPASNQALVTDARSAELSQYYTNIHHAKKLSIFNSLIALIHHLVKKGIAGGDVNAIAAIAGRDNRIGIKNLKIGLGFSAWLKKIIDVLYQRVASLRKRMGTRLDHVVRIVEYFEKMLELIRDANQIPLAILKELIEEYDNSSSFDPLSEKRVVLLGVSNRAGSKRIANSPSLELIKWFQQKGVQHISIYDPHASREEFLDWQKAQNKINPAFSSTLEISFLDNEGALFKELPKTDLAVLGMYHPEILSLNLRQLSEGLRGRRFYDGWNTIGLQPDGSQAVSFSDQFVRQINYISLGRAPRGPQFKYYFPFESKYIRRSQDIPAPLKHDQSKRVAVLGAGGYVGVVLAYVLAKLHRVIGVDINESKVDMLNNGQSPIYEPGLDEHLKLRLGENLKFTTDGKQAVRDSQITFIAVGTPTKEDGSVDLSYVISAARTVGEIIKEQVDQKTEITADNRKIIVIKSTVTPNVFVEISRMMRNEFNLDLGVHYALASNPEFLREGQALHDVEFPDRIVYGIDIRMSEQAIKDTERVLLELIREDLKSLELAREKDKNVPEPLVIITDHVSAPLGKYMANLYLGSDISSANIWLRLARFFGAVWAVIAKIMKMHRAIPRTSFFAGSIGFGGSCFPKDMQAIHRYFADNGVDAPLLRYFYAINQEIKKNFVAEIIEFVQGYAWNPELVSRPLQSKQIGIWGLAFKPDTDDVRESPAFDIILGLLNAGAAVVAHDPLEKAAHNFLSVINEFDRKSDGKRYDIADPKTREMLRQLKGHLETGRLKIIADKYEVARGSDAVVLLTDWKDYDFVSDVNLNGVDFAKLKSIFEQSLKQPIIIAGRSLWDGSKIAALGLEFYALDQRSVHAMARSELRTSDAERIESLMQYVEVLAMDDVRLRLSMPGLIGNFIYQMRGKLLGSSTSSLAMIPSFVKTPTGNERGTYLAIDLGGTNLRVLKVNLLGKGKWDGLREWSVRIPNQIKQAKTKEQFFDYIAEQVGTFIRQEGLKHADRLITGFTFSFPVRQEGIAQGFFVRWNKGFHVPGMKGQDVVELLREALVRRNIQNVKIAALVNDTVGTLATSTYQDPSTAAGVILGTGTNGAYWEREVWGREYVEAVNLEWGGFNGYQASWADVSLRESMNLDPNAQPFERVISGLYLGELVRLILKNSFIEKRLLFGGRSSNAFDKPESEEDETAGFKSEYLSLIVSDEGDLPETNQLLQRIGIPDSTLQDRIVVQRVARAIVRRAAQLSAIAIIAAIQKGDPSFNESHVVGIDGSLFEKNSWFASQLRLTIQKLLGEKEERINLKLTKDGSGIGAAIIAATASEFGTRSELRASSRTYRKFKRWFRERWLIALTLTGIITLGPWYSYHIWKISQDSLVQAQKAMKKAKGVNLAHKHNSIQFLDQSNERLLENPFLQASIDEALSHLRVTDVVVYSEISRIEIVPTDHESRRERYPYVLRIENRNQDRKFIDLQVGNEYLINTAENVQTLILGMQHANFASKKVDVPRALVFLALGIPAVLLAGILGEAILKLNRNRLNARQRASEVKTHQHSKTYALGKSGRTTRDNSNRSELRLEKNPNRISREFAGGESKPIDAKSELRFVQRAVLLADRFAPTPEFLSEHHPDLMNPLTGTRAGLSEFLVKSAFASVQKPVAIHSQIVRIINAQNGIDVEEFAPALKAIVQNRTRLVILLSNDAQDRASNLHRQLSDRLALIAKETGETKKDHGAQIVVQSVSGSRERVAALITQLYLSADIREKTAVIARDSLLLERVRSGLRLRNDLEGNSIAQADALVRIINSLNNLGAIQERFGVIELSDLLGTFSLDRGRNQKIRVSA